MVDFSERENTNDTTLTLNDWEDHFEGGAGCLVPQFML